MAVTKRSFAGQPSYEWKGDPGFPRGLPAQDLLTNVTGAKAQQSSVSKGRHHGMRPPGYDADDPRRLYTAAVGGASTGTIPSGSELDPNRASTGRHQPERVLITGQKAPQTTGSGEGSEHIHSYDSVVQGTSTHVNRRPRRPDRLLGTRNQGG
jgi:hypothetical protein